MTEEFIELNRDFCPISKWAEVESVEDFQMRMAFGLSSMVHWDDLLKEPRVIILAKAGAGKTDEIKNLTKQLRAKEKQAFFLRLEYLKDDFELAFMGDSYGEFFEFQAWTETNEKAWLFLDSVDEAKLRDPGDFEKGLRKLKLQLGDKAQQVNIIITSRLTWEPKTEFALVKQLLPYHPEKQVAEVNEIEQNFELNIKQSKNKDDEVNDDEKYPKVYSLASLNDNQIKVFAKAKGVTDTNSFFEAIGRADAGIFTSSPDDLKDLIYYWDENRTIGTRSELIEHSLKKKLVESDTIRSELKPLIYEKALAGAQLIAAVVTLTPFSRIAVPDKEKVPAATPITEILPNWTLSECKTLIERPVFDEAVYGTIRFHTRSVREYLAAQWILRLLGSGTRGSRRHVENLFFRVQYEEEVLTPTLRPILPWVAICDDRFRQKVMRIAPEALLEGGDPSQFPSSVRTDILESLCREMAISKSHHHSFDINAVERFSNSDIEQTISSLLDKYIDSPEIRALLLRMVWQGKLESCTMQVMPLVKDKNLDKYTRICAIRAIQSAGTVLEKQEVVEYFINNSDEFDHSILDAVIELFGFEELSVSGLIIFLDRLPNPGEYNISDIDYTLKNLIGKVPLPDLQTFVEKLSVLLSKEPHIEYIHCDVSQQHEWLINIAMKGCERLIINRSIFMFKKNMLGLLSRYSIYRHCHGRKDLGESFVKIVPEWRELNNQLFWYDVARAMEEKTNAVTELWQISNFGTFWDSKVVGFETSIGWIKEKSKIKDKRIALSIAFNAYVSDGRKRKTREILKNSVSEISELKSALQNYLTPPPQTEEQKKWNRERRDYNQSIKQEKEKWKQERKKWKAWLSDNIKSIIDTTGAAEGKLLKAQKYLFNRLRKVGKDTNQWTCGNWEDLIKDQNQAVAEAFRDFLIAYWRQYKPALCSESIEKISHVPYGVILGLSGLSIEAMDPSWPYNLTRDEAMHAARYSLLELNGFPNWLPRLHAGFPEIVEAHLLKEIEWELAEHKEDSPCHYAIDALVYYGEWIRSKLGNSVFELLKNVEPKHTSTLQKTLEIIFDSKLVEDTSLEILAENKIGQNLSYKKQAVWYAVWVSVNPDKAIPKLELDLSEFSDTNKAIDLAMGFISNLIGGKHFNFRNIGEKFKQRKNLEKYLERLYFMMHKYICIADDIGIPMNGEYLCTLREEAQEARENLLSMLTQIPGKSTFLALKRIACEFSNEKNRSWMQTHPKIRAEQDADIGAWSVQNVIDFADNQERQPGNAKQLFELSVNRLLDLKYELENNEDSVAATWKRETEETKLRILIAKWLRDRAFGKYSVHQEEEQADAKKPDIRILGSGFDTPVPIELKIVDNNWSGPKLFERLENQLCNDYLRDYRTTYGVYLLIYQGINKKWEHPTTKKRMDFVGLVEALKQHAKDYIRDRGEIDAVSVIGIDLTARLKSVRFST